MKEDFFSILGHLAMRRHPEDQLSNTFRACFNYSAIFRETTLRLLWTICELRGYKLRSDHWTCTTQVTDEASRYDIHLKPLPANSSTRTPAITFVLESKINARLTKDQLRKYAKSARQGGKCIVAITKSYPDVAQSWMKQHGIASLRWQDLYRDLSGANYRTSTDKFLSSQFLSYLEGANMAHETIYLSALEQFADLLSIVRKGHRDGKVNKMSFRTGDASLDLLEELRLSLMEHFGKSQIWNIWGPGYYTEEEKDGLWHLLGFSLWKRKVSVNCAFAFPQDSNEDVYFYFYYWNEKKKNFERKPSCFKPLRNFCKDNVLDKDKLVKQSISHLRKWGITN